MSFILEQKQHERPKMAGVVLTQNVYKAKFI